MIDSDKPLFRLGKNLMNVVSTDDNLLYEINFRRTKQAPTSAGLPRQLIIGRIKYSSYS